MELSKTNMQHAAEMLLIFVATMTLVWLIPTGMALPAVGSILACAMGAGVGAMGAGAGPTGIATGISIGASVGISLAQIVGFLQDHGHIWSPKRCRQQHTV